MSEFNLDKVIRLLENANELGINVSFADEELSVRFQKGNKIDKGILDELKLNKPFLIHYFKTYAVKGNKLTVKPIPKAERSGLNGIQLSYAQERMWFIDQLEGSVRYHIPSVLQLKGNLNNDALTYAMQQIVNRHEVLRTVIRESDGQPLQYTREKDGWQLNMVDASMYFEQAELLQNYIQQLINEPFDLSKDYMIRAHLLRVSEQYHVLVVTLHHIASDGWSTSIIVRELVELYDAFEKGRNPVLPALPIQYADFATWQRQYLQGELLDKKIAYWKEKLKGLATLHLPVDYERPAVQSARGAAISFNISKDLSDRIRLMGLENGATLFMTLLAAFNVLLHRYSGQQDICVGTPIAGRDQQEVEGLIGFFINSLVLRSDLSNDPSFSTLLQQVKTTTLEAYDHKELPFEKVVDATVKERTLSRSPIFQVMFSLQNTPEISELRLGQLQLSGGGAGLSAHNTAKFDLTFNITETAGGLQVTIEYCTDLFKEQTLLSMADHFRNLLQSTADAPHQSIGTLAMLNEVEIHHLLVELNDTKKSFSTNRTVVHLFAEQVKKNPGAIALSFSGRQVSYSELNDRSNRVAHYLRSRGVKQETLVPVCMKRSIELITAMLGILKAGGAYIPIDPDYPVERISFMLEDTGASLLFAGSGIAQQLPASANIEIIDLVTDALSINHQPAHDLQTPVEPHHLAYVIYTSGSTGKPKGVMIEHKGLTNLINWHNYEYAVSPSSRATAMAGIGFDAFGWEIWPYLSCGASLFIVDDETRLDLPRLVDLFIAGNISHSFIATALVPEFVKESLNKNTALQYLLTGGDKLSSINQEGLSYKLVNNYGPTENTVVASYYELLKNNEHIIPPIGKPISNTVIYLLNEQGQLVPQGSPGELYIGGASLARGYLNRPDLTAEKFINDPFDKTVGARLYRSGDLGRWLPDGNIEYLGRIDEQVKIRGYRIELGEIETCVLQSGLVSQAVVLAKEDEQGVKRLVGYVVANGWMDKEAMSIYLHGKLPEYMVPAIWVTLDNLPLTPNGKIDKKALPAPQIQELLKNEYTAPRNAPEEQLATIWKELLNLQRVGIHDNFFELGGDSILTIQVVSRARRLGFELQPKDLFIHQTIGRLSAAIAARSGAMVLGEQGVLTGLSGLVPIQQWYFEMEQADINHFNQAVLLGISKVITGHELAQAVEQLMEQHDALRFKYHKQDDQWQQEYGNYTSELITEDLQSIPLGLLGSAITEKATAHQRGLNITTGELLRVVWVQTPGSEANNRLLIVAHHLAIDGVSWRILLEDLELLLDGLKKGEKTKLGHKSSSYRQWYHALENYGQSRRLLSQLNYWQQAVKTYQALPVDKNYNSPVKSKDIAQRVVRLGAEQTSRLLQEVPRVYHTEINDLLLAALALTISNWSGNETINIGLEGHGREEIEPGIDTSRTIGWFTSLYPLLLVMPEVRQEADIIKSVKEQLRQLPGKGLGYGVLKYINKENSLAGVTEPWDIVFNYLGQLDNVVRESKWLSGAGESSGPGRSEEYIVNEKISINSSVLEGELLISWSYSIKHYDEATIQQLSAAYLTNLEQLIVHCMEQQKTVGTIFTPSDYGLGAEVSYKELDRFLTEPWNGRERSNSIEGLYRLSGLQQGMLFHGLYDAGIGAYMEQFGCDLFGVDLEILNRSWAHIIRRHSILRSAFYFDAFSVPVQCVYKEVALPLVVLDYRGLGGDEQLTAIHEFEEADRNKGFDFKTAPLMRLGLFRLSEDRYRMIWTSHHILFDGWSLPILMEEFLSTYELLRSGGEVLSVEEDRYEDYIRYIERSDQEQEEQYWRNYLHGIEQNTLLPFIGTTTERNKGAGAYQTLAIHLDAAATTKLQGYAQVCRVTLNTIMQGVWAYLLHHYTGNKNIVFGIVVSGRPEDLSGVEHRVGMYINTLPLHSVIKDEEGIVEWLQGIQSDQVASRQHQHTPLHIVQGWSGVQGDLFDTLLTFENYPVSKVIASKQWALNIGNVNMQEQTNYPLSIVIGSGEHTNISFSYNAMLLDEVYVNEIRGHFENVLLQLIEKGTGRVSDINLLTLAEQEQLLLQFNETKADHPDNRSIVELFEEQVSKTPDALALVFNEEKFSYRQLNERSNQLARYLKSRGVKAGTLVPICINPSLAMMEGILGILKAGGAYIPIDPDYPEERIAWMLEDTIASIVITNEANRLKLPVSAGVDIIAIDGDFKTVDQYASDNLKETIHPDQLAYIIYTSGSTGKPKGVMIEHGSLHNYLLNNKTNYIGSGANKAGSYIHLSYTFDASLTAMFMPLLYGRPVVIGSKQSVDVFEDSNLLQYAPYDFIKITPAHLELLQPKFKAFGKGLLAEKLVIGGEALRPSQFDMFIAEGIDVEVINEYGPTEATVGCTTYSFHTLADKNKIKDGISIGKPIGNSLIYILDERNALVPVGVKGEICIGGAGLARGYLNQPGLTAEKFIRNPFSGTTSDRLYKTGDIGRWFPGGNIEYLGRMDDQVKIRGYRVELGEVEHQLQQCEAVSQGVVLGKEEKEGGNRLVSYYTPHLAAIKSKELELHYQRVASWKELYETEYGQTEGDENIDPEFNIIGWNDSFSGEPIPAEQMKEWLDDIVTVVLSGQPENVLEIGCGTGLIYYQLAGRIKKYIGSDLSRSSINQITQRTIKGLRDYGETELFTAPAHEVSLDEGQQVDTILLNSMVQYFPGEDYMNVVIEKTMGLINGTGRIIIGDVRDNRLLELFKGRLRIQKLQDSVTVQEYKWGLEQDLLKEEELCFSPGYFYGLKDIYPRVTHVAVEWKQGDYVNELSLYRYTVVLYVGIEKELVLPQWQSWNEVANKNTIISENNQALPNRIAICDVPNPRLWKERSLQQALQNKSLRTVGEILHGLATEDQETVQIKQLLKQARSKGYSYRLFVQEDPLKINLLLEINPSEGFIQQPSAQTIQPTNDLKTNIPLFTDISFLLQKDIKEQLLGHLPDYMVPSEFFALRQLPLTNNGKVDRLFLSRREERVFVNTLNYLPPSTAMEKAIAVIWKELLHLERVGIEDNFFDLGGHSLLAMRVISAIRKELEVELNIKELFVHPTIGLLAGHIEKLGKGLLLPPIEAHPRPENIPLSFSQERLWFIDQLDGSLQYHTPAVLRLKGRLDTSALSAALQQIINRHEVLRTVIRQQEGQGYQQIREKDGWQLSVADSSVFKEDVEGLKRYIKQLIDIPFDLTKDYMLRATLVTLGEQDHILVAVLHHIASDGWSTSIMVNELAELYNAKVEHRAASLPSLPIQFADYAIWQRTYLRGETWDKKLGYWKSKLEGVATLQLPTNYPRPLVQSTNGAIAGFEIDKDLSDQLQKFSQQQGATLFMTLLAAFNVLLYRYTGQQDICVGTPIAGRQHREVEGLIGFFVNTLALRNQILGSASFSDVLQQVKSTTLDAYNYQEVPFEKVVELVVRERDFSRSPLFQVMLVLQNTPDIQDLRLGELQLSTAGTESVHNTSRFELSFSILESARGLNLTVEYCTDLFTEQTILRMAGHFRNLLRSVVTTPHQSIGVLPMLNEVETHHLLVGLNNTSRAFPTSKTVVDLFAEQVLKTPEAIALVFNGEQLTYKGLDERSNSLANYLSRKGVTNETIVPVCMRRSMLMITSMMAILKAGGAYVPIDPEYPAERISFMLEDTGATILLTTSEIALQLPATLNIEIIDLEEKELSIYQQSMNDPLMRVEPQNLAYVIYTSGSTGKPKGVMIEHKGLSNLVHWHNQAFMVTESSRATAMAGVGFDAFGWEVWPYLCCGASLCIIDDTTRLDLPLLAEFFVTQQITHSFVATAVVPDFIKLLPDFVNQSNKNKINLQYMLTGGDKLPSVDLHGLSYKLINNYGPTENTVVTSSYELLKNSQQFVPPIGKPISNTVIYLLNEQGQLVPEGVQGELCIGGAGIARGYLNRPGLTAEKFINDPFAKAAGSKFYKSGDLARWLPDGNIEYLGRIDEQVKIRGHRIELGEIENCLLESGLVSQVVVLAKEDKQGNKRLVGYVVSEGYSGQEAFVSFLKERLPGYMVPGQWVEMEHFPMTNNGKIDRKALADPGVMVRLNNEYVAPRSEVEEKLAEIWKDLLQVERVGMYDNFFELGGHSLLAMRMVAHIEKSLLVSIPIKVLFQFTCISDLSKYLEIQANDRPGENIMPFKLYDV